MRQFATCCRQPIFLYCTTLPAFVTASMSYRKTGRHLSMPRSARGPNQSEGIVPLRLSNLQVILLLLLAGTVLIAAVLKYTSVAAAFRLPCGISVPRSSRRPIPRQQAGIPPVAQWRRRSSRRIAEFLSSMPAWAISHTSTGVSMLRRLRHPFSSPRFSGCRCCLPVVSKIRVFHHRPSISPALNTARISNSMIPMASRSR